MGGCLKVVLALVGLAVAISILGGLFANSFVVFLISLAVFVTLTAIQRRREGAGGQASDSAGGPLVAFMGIALLCTLLFGGVALGKAVLGGNEPERASEPAPRAEANKEEQPPEEAEKTAGVEEVAADAEVEEEAAPPAPPRDEARAEPPPQPRTPEERIRAAVKKDSVEPEKEFPRIAVERDQGGCYRVTVRRIDTSGDPGQMEFGMESVYEGVYSDPALRKRVCSVSVNTWAELTDDYGQSTQEKVYSTSMDQATAQRVNWKESYMVEFANVWKTDYVHPAVEGEKSKQAAEEAIDCAQDEGLFDVDAFCP